MRKHTIFDETKLQQSTQKILPAIYLIWAGLILGVSFIATPVKFQASNLTMPLALEVGKVTFHLFNMIEWGVIITAIILTTISASIKWLMPIILFALLAIQTFWLLPILDIRADEVIAGRAPSSQHYHWFYIVAETLKLAFTISAAWACSRR